MHKRLLSLLLVLCLLAVMPGRFVSAEEDVPVVVLETFDGETTQTTTLTPEEAAAIPMPMAAIAYHDTAETAAADVAAQLMAGESSVVVGINLPYDKALVGQIYGLAFSHTGSPTAGDYLNNRCRGYNASMSVYSNRFSITYTPNYATTAEQEAQVDAKVAQILPAIRRDSDYHTVLDIFRWLRANVSYQSGDIIQHTAYGALVNGNGVCESYAAAFYRLALECGVDCRIVSGLLIDGGHAWNIVELDGTWYVLDATNDIFLRCEASVENLLVPETLYDDAAYPGSYTVSTTDYTADILYTLENGVLTLPTTNSVTDYYRDVTDLLQEQYLGGIPNPDSFLYSVAPWESALTQVTQVKLGGSPSFIPSRMFYWNNTIQAVTIPASVKTIGESAFNSCLAMRKVYFTGTQAQWDTISVEEYNNTLGWVTLNYNAEPVPEPHVHSYAGAVTTPAGCETDGAITYTCACGESYTEAIAALGHSYSSVVTAPTCTTQGYTMFTCKCGDSYTDFYVSATGHSYASGVCSVCGEKDPDYVAPDPDKNGLHKSEDGEYYYYVDGEIATGYTGFINNAAGSWYIVSGHCDLARDGMVTADGTKYLLKSGRVNTAFTGITKQEGVYYYFAEGVNDLAFEGLVLCNGMKAYVQEGEVNFNKSGVVEDSGNLVYVKYGIWRNTFKGLARAEDGNWLYFANGTFDQSYTGVAKLNANWVYAENGKVNFSFSGTVTVGAYDYTVKYGVIQF